MAPYYKTPNGENIVWRQEINFEAPKYDEFGKQIGSYYAKGFIGILERMSTSVDNGILLFRRGRVIGSSFDEKYRPKILSGEEGSPRYKRIFGELELDGFDVSFTKSSFQDDDEFTTFIEIMRDDMIKDKSIDLFGQAQNYTKPKSQADKKRAAQQLVKTIVDEISKPIVIPEDAQELDVEIPTVVAQPSTSNVSNVQDSSAPNNEPIEILPIEIEVSPNANSSFKLVISGTSGASNSGLYTLVHNPDGKYYANINLSNGFFERFRDCLSSEDNINQLAYFIKNLVVTELLLLESGTHGATTFRNKFNQLFGLI